MKGVTLIGMPGSGKSTVGRLLAEKMGFLFADLDNLIRDGEGVSHSHIAAEKGDQALVKMEESYVARLNLEKTVFAPGGSVIYSPAAMTKLKRDTRVIFLAAPLESIEKNLGEQIESRGIVGLKERGLAGVFSDRQPLYEKYADYRIDCAGLAPEEVCSRILALFV